MSDAPTLWDDPRELPVAAVLDQNHYLRRVGRGDVYRDEYGLMVFASVSSRLLNRPGFMELTRWCLWGGPNAGSMQWRRCRAWLLTSYPVATTVVSYSDPSVGHDGALYRACGWLWAPSAAFVLGQPSGGGGSRPSAKVACKHRWVYPLRRDEGRETALGFFREPAARRRYPYAEYREPKWKRGRPQLQTGGGDYKRWAMEREAA